jgi:hypothetical protein
MRKHVSTSSGQSPREINVFSVVMDKYHWMLYFLAPAMYPRFLITLDEKLENKAVTVRVGQVRFATEPV